MRCPRCESEKVKKNGTSHTGKQNYYCHDCKRQFLDGGQAWFVSDEKKNLVNRLLLERISLSGISRVVGVSETWLYNYIKELYAGLPEDLNADAEMPDEEEYLDQRFEEEIGRLEEVKKNRLHWKNTRR